MRTRGCCTMAHIRRGAIVLHTSPERGGRRALRRRPLFRSSSLVPVQLRLVDFYDLGRVVLDGETSHLWHHGTGGGLFASAGRRHLVSFTVARSEGHTAFYVRAGLGL